VGWNKIELAGRVVRKPELRAAPSGQSLVRFVVDCGQANRKLELGVVVLGNAGRDIQRRIIVGTRVRVCGRLTAARRGEGSGFSDVQWVVVASEVAPEMPSGASKPASGSLLPRVLEQRLRQPDSSR